MCAMHYFEELRSISARINLLLPPENPCLEEDRVFAGRRQDAVIEAKPAAVLSLGCESTKWLFNRSMPPLLQEQSTRRAFVQQVTEFQTELNCPVVSKQASYPLGVSTWHPTDQTRRITLLTRHDMDLLFQPGIGDTLPYDEEHGLFTLPGRRCLCFRDCMELIRERAPYLRRTCVEYARLASHMYGLSLHEFGETTRIFVRRHSARAGCPLRLWDTSESRYDGGPVLIIALGLPTTAHDMGDTLTRADQAGKRITRAVLAEGIMMAVDGDARFRFSHGFPAGQASDRRVFYSIVMYMSCQTQTNIVGYEGETRTMVMYTPITLASVITTRPAPAYPVHQDGKGYRDSLWRIIKSIRARLGSAESTLMTQNFIALAQRRAGITSETRQPPMG